MPLTCVWRVVRSFQSFRLTKKVKLLEDETPDMILKPEMLRKELMPSVLLRMASTSLLTALERCSEAASGSSPEMKK